jgi:hypothetical protein
MNIDAKREDEGECRNNYILTKDGIYYLDNEEKNEIEEERQVVEDTNLNYHIEQLKRRLDEKDNIIHKQNQQIADMGLMIGNLKNNTKTLHEKLAESDKNKVHISAQEKGIKDLEDDMIGLKEEYL